MTNKELCLIKDGKAHLSLSGVNYKCVGAKVPHGLVFESTLDNTRFQINEGIILSDPRVEIAFQSEWEERLNRGLWKTKNGDEIPISQMTTEHIKNCISMLETSIDKDCMVYDEYQAEKAYAETFKAELKRRARNLEKE